MKTFLFSLLGIFLFSNFTEKAEKKSYFFDYTYTYKYPNVDRETTIMINSKDSSYILKVSKNFEPNIAYLVNQNNEFFYTFLFEKPMKFQFLAKENVVNNSKKIKLKEEYFVKLEDTINATLNLECYYKKKNSNKLYATVTAKYDKSDFKFNNLALNYLTHGLTSSSKMGFIHNGVPNLVEFRFSKKAKVACVLIHKQKIQQTITIE